MAATPPPPRSPTPSPADLAAGAAAVGRCIELADCTDEPGRITRLYLGPGTKRAHLLLRHWMHEAGMTTRIDPAGNLIGRLAATDRDDREPRVLLLGSHIDTVPNAGRFDGPLGVVVAIAAAHRLGNTPLPFHLDAIAFSEEEGVRFGLSYIGSSAVAGRFDPDWLDRVDEDGVTMRAAIESFGLYPDAMPDAAYRRDQVIGYCEAHIEQGTMLQRMGLPVSLVRDIAGQTRMRMTFHGAAAHAGTTPMTERADALVAAARFIAAAADYREPTGGLRATVGRIDNAPNAPNVVPDRTTLSLDLRHPDDTVRQRAIDDLIAAAERIAAAVGVRFTVDESRTQPAIGTVPQLLGPLTAAVAEVGVPLHAMVSWAGHDAVAMADLCPVAMLFIRHPGGVSHHPDETVDAADVAVAIDVLARFIRGMAVAHAPIDPATKDTAP